jgi:hypothetical protein
MDPDRADGTAFAATVKDTVASPCPLRLPPMDTQDVSVATDQVQSRAAATVTEPAPPFAVNDDVAFVTAI